MSKNSKLEIKYLCSYLPYGLKVKNQFGVHEVLGLRSKSSSNNNLMISYKLHGDVVWGYSYQNKPLLRPMSDLYKEINGEVGIVELAKIEHPCSTYHILRNRCVEVAGVNCNSLSFRYDKDNNYFLNSNFDCDDEYYPIMYQLEIFEYLFANHYDVFGLIEQGLAINKNDIE